MNHLLRDGRGYDARVRHAFKRLAVVVLSHELKVGGILRVDLDDEEDLDVLFWGDRETNSSSGERNIFDDAEELALLATRKFEGEIMCKEYCVKSYKILTNYFMQPWNMQLLRNS